MIKVEILKCDACGRLAVWINDYRVTSHKCAGIWTPVLSEECDLTDALEGTAFAPRFKRKSKEKSR